MRLHKGGAGILKIGKGLGIGTGTVQRAVMEQQCPFDVDVAEAEFASHETETPPVRFTLRAFWCARMFAMSGDVVEKFTGDPRVAGVTPAAERHRRSGAPADSRFPAFYFLRQSLSLSDM